jgi:hypothetical protein
MLRDGSRFNPLAIHEDNNHDIYVQGLSEYMVKNTEECLALLRVGEEGGDEGGEGGGGGGGGGGG